MTVLEVKLDGEQLNYHLGLKEDANVRASYAIRTDDPCAGGIQLITDAQNWIPGPGQPSPPYGPLPKRYDLLDLLGETDGSLTCSLIEARRDPDNHYRWNALVDWRVLPPGHQPSDNIANPVDRPAYWYFEYQAETEIVTTGYNVDAINSLAGVRPADTYGPLENAARDLFDDPLTRERKMPVLVIVQNYTSGLSAAALNHSYDLTINDALFLGFIPKHCAKFDGATQSAPRFENGYKFYETQIRISFRRQPYYTEIANKGGRAWNGTEVADIEVPVGDGTEKERVNHPMSLTTQGEVLWPGTGPTNYIKYRIHEEADFGPLEALIPGA